MRRSTPNASSNALKVEEMLKPIQELIIGNNFKILSLLCMQKEYCFSFPDQGNAINLLKQQINTLNGNFINNNYCFQFLAKFLFVFPIHFFFFSDTVKEQNIVIVSLLTEVHVLIKSNFSPAMISTKYMTKFPLKSEQDLLEMEKEISDETKDAIVST